MIQEADIFIAVLKEYGKDTAAEIGMAYAWKKPCIGIDYGADESDVMCYYAFDKIIKPEQLDDVLYLLSKKTDGEVI